MGQSVTGGRPRRSFGSWLLAQGERQDSIGALARYAGLDPAFPPSGDYGQVKQRLYATGAKIDAFAALDRAEIDWLAY